MNKRWTKTKTLLHPRLHPPDLTPGVAEDWLLMVTRLRAEFRAADLAGGAARGVGAGVLVFLGLAELGGVSFFKSAVVGVLILGLTCLGVTDLLPTPDFGVVVVLAGVGVAAALGLADCGGVRAAAAAASSGAPITWGLANLGVAK